MLLNTGDDTTETGARCGLLGAVESLIAGVFLPTIETQSRSWNIKEPQSSSVKAELVNSLSSFVHVLTSRQCCFLRSSSLFVCDAVSSENWGLKHTPGQMRQTSDL